MMARVDLVHVPYRASAAALTDLITGQVQARFDNLPTSIEYIKADRLLGLAVTSATRSEFLPSTPTIGEFVPGYDASAVAGIGAPKGTPSEIIDRLNREINAAIAVPKIKARLTDLGATPVTLTPADYGRFNAAEVEKWGKVVKFSGAKAE